MINFIKFWQKYMFDFIKFCNSLASLAHPAPPRTAFPGLRRGKAVRGGAGCARRFKKKNRIFQDLNQQSHDSKSNVQYTPTIVPTSTHLHLACPLYLTIPNTRAE